MKSRQTTIRLKNNTFKVLEEIMKEKGFSRGEAIEYCVNSYADFIRRKLKKVSDKK